MKTFMTNPRLPEEPTLRFWTTGTQGGDAGHGGEAALRILLPNTGAHVFIKSDSGEPLFDQMVEGESILDVTVLGDWELDGLENAILELADLIRGEKE